MDELTIHRAAKEGQLDRVRQLIEAGLSVDSFDDEGWTPLHWAARRGRFEVAKLLIDGGCDLNRKSEGNGGGTPLWFAASEGNKDVVDLLIARGAQMNCGGQNGTFALLHIASRNGWSDVVLRILEEGGADFNAAMDSFDVEGWTPLHWAARRGRFEVAKLLIDRGCNLNPKSEGYGGGTPLWFAASEGNKDVVDLLIARGAQMNCGGQNGTCTLLHIASRKGWSDVVLCIVIEGRSDLNAAARWDVEGVTPLMFAAEAGHAAVAATLVGFGADVNRRNAWKRTALHMAAYHGHCSVVQLLLRKEGVDVDPQDAAGETPLHKACMRERQDVFTRNITKKLLVVGADPNIKNIHGQTALSIFMRVRRPDSLKLEVIRPLVQGGAFFEESDYVRLSQNPFLKENVLKDASLCTASVVNKFHRQSLPALKSITYFARRLPNVDNFALSARQIDEVENLVKSEIKTNKFCNVVKVRPMALSALCVLSLITCRPGME